MADDLDEKDLNGEVKPGDGTGNGGDKAEELKALKAERELRKAAETKLRELSEAAEKAEAERLVEQGKFKEIAEKAQAENRALKAAQEHAEFVATVHKQFSENDLATLADHALKMRTAKTADEMLDVAKSLRAEFDKAVEAKVNEKLETGARPKSGGTAPDSNAKGLVYASMK